MLHVGVLEGLVCENGNGTVWVGLAQAHFQIFRNSVFLQFFEVPAHTHTVPLPFSWRARRADAAMGRGDGGTNGCVVGGWALGVSGPQKPKFSSIWVEKRLRNG
jgi:hypothetical protein